MIIVRSSDKKGFVDCYDTDDLSLEVHKVEEVVSLYSKDSSLFVGTEDAESFFDVLRPTEKLDNKFILSGEMKLGNNVKLLTQTSDTGFTTVFILVKGKCYATRSLRKGDDFIPVLDGSTLRAYAVLRKFVNLGLWYFGEISELRVKRCIMMGVSAFKSSDCVDYCSGVDIETGNAIWRD